MNKKQFLKFSKAIADSTGVKETISAFANKKGYAGRRTLERCCQAAAGFKKRLPSKVIAERTGWSVKYVDKIRSWWEQEAATGTVIEQKPYEETRHKRKMREMAKELAGRINLPSAMMKDLWRDLPVEFQPGKYSLPIGAVEIGAVEIDEDKQIKVNYYDIGAGIAAPHLVKGLYSHLSTSGLSRFADLVGDKGKLDNWVSVVGQYFQALLMFLMLITDEVKGYRAKVSFHDEAKPGLTKWFIVTAWNDALEKAGGFSWIGDSWYKPHESIRGTNLWQLRCGSYSIGIAKSEETLQTYEGWHKKLRLKYAAHPSAKDIYAKSQEMSNIAQDIRQRLLELSDMEHVPGHCELCSE